jgi:diadenosine tetraphosphatase ApaH/serine/threonine PP2A family protein phosphatase
VWEYLLDTRTATANFEHFKTPFCFVGHTHLPVIYAMHEDNHLARLSIPDPGQKLILPGRAIVNPGSVGQPRDRDPRASFAIYEPVTHTWDYQRVPYDVAAVQSRMHSLGLPDRHIYRLSAGW